MVYRFYSISVAGFRHMPVDHELASDTAAIDLARSMVGGSRGVEVWAGLKLVEVIPAEIT